MYRYCCVFANASSLKILKSNIYTHLSPCVAGRMTPETIQKNKTGSINHAEGCPRTQALSQFIEVALIIKGVPMRESEPQHYILHRCSQIMKKLSYAFFAVASFFSFSTKAGTTFFKSHTIPKSATSKIGAYLSLLTATMKSDPSIPAKCWIAPEIPNAK